MANLVITTDSDFIDVDFGIYSPQVGEKARFHRRDILNVIQFQNYVQIEMIGVSTHWQISLNGESSTFVIDSINGVTPSDISNLYTTIKNLMK